MQSTARSVTQYLAELPPDRRDAIEAVRRVVNANVEPFVEESMTWGMIGWSIPHSVYPAGYHTKPEAPVPYACLASQKNYMSLYLTVGYAEGTPNERWFREEWAKTGKKLDMGKSCIRFKRVDDLALDVIAAALHREPASAWLKAYAKLDPRTASGQAAKSARTSKRAATAKKSAKKSAKQSAKMPSKTAKMTAAKAKKRPANKK